jgi:hypothetical protein
VASALSGIGVNTLQNRFIGAVQQTMQKKHGLQKFEKNVNNMQAIQLGPNANNKAQNTLDLMFRTFHPLMCI